MFASIEKNKLLIIFFLSLSFLCVQFLKINTTNSFVNTNEWIKLILSSLIKYEHECYVTFNFPSNSFSHPIPFKEHRVVPRRKFPGSLLSSPLLSFLYHATTRSTSYIRPRSGIYTSLNARFRWPTWQLKAAFLVAKNDLPGMDQRPPTRMPIYGQPRGRASIDTSGWEGRA